MGERVYHNYTCRKAKMCFIIHTQFWGSRCCYNKSYFFWHNWNSSPFFSFKDFIYFRDMWKEGGREGEKYRLVASCMPPTRDLACNPGMCPDLELSRWLFRFSGRCPTHWATSVRASLFFLTPRFLPFPADCYAVSRSVRSSSRS